MKPEKFPDYAYYMAFASAIILMLAFILGLRIFDFMRFARNIVWLALVTSAMGTFFALAARSDFQKNEPDDETRYKVRLGLRVNVAALVFMILASLLAIIVGILGGIRI